MTKKYITCYLCCHRNPDAFNWKSKKTALSGHQTQYNGRRHQYKSAAVFAFFRRNVRGFSIFTYFVNEVSSFKMINSKPNSILVSNCVESSIQTNPGVICVTHPSTLCRLCQYSRLIMLIHIQTNFPYHDPGSTVGRTDSKKVSP